MDDSAIKGVIKIRVNGVWTPVRSLLGATGPTGNGATGPIGPTGPTGVGPTGPTGPMAQITGVIINLGASQSDINERVATALQKLGVEIQW